MMQATLPFQSHSETSKAAAEVAKSTALSMRLEVYCFIGRGSATDEEIQIGLRMNPSTQRPRRIELVNQGKVRDSGQKRSTRSGRWATVWEVVND